jgi:type II secretory pathway component GspD/PulD (secretin)
MAVNAARPDPIEITRQQEDIFKRMQRKITLDVRDMNVVDVIKFLADEERGDFNVVISPTVQGRVTVYLNNVSIRDALDIIIISNHLAYKVEGNIIQVMSAVEYEAMYGKKFSDKTEVAIIHLKYSRPSYVLAALDNLKSNVGKIIIDEDTGSVVLIDTKESIALMKEAIKEIEKPLETFIYPLQCADAEVVANQLRLRIDAKAVGSITPDTRSNRIIARAYPDRIKEIEQIIKELDTQTKEVLVDARVLQVVYKPQYDMGIDWQLDFRGSPNKEIRKLSFSNMFLDKDNMTSSDNMFSKYGQLAVGNFDVDQFEMTVRAMKQVSDTKILSNPKLLVVDKQEAKIHIGDTVPYIISTTSGTGDNAITSEDVRFVDVGLKLNVVPRINDEGYVTMRLRPEISTVTGTVDSKGGGIPQVNKTEVETSVIVKDGYTIVMGGLKKEDKTHVKKGIPGLMDVPFLGPLFGSTSDSMTNTEIIIFITPTIMTGDEDYTRIEGGIKPFKEYSTD